MDNWERDIIIDKSSLALDSDAWDDTEILEVNNNFWRRLYSYSPVSTGIWCSHKKSQGKRPAKEEFQEYKRKGGDLYFNIASTHHWHGDFHSQEARKMFILPPVPKKVLWKPRKAIRGSAVNGLKIRRLGNITSISIWVHSQIAAHTLTTKVATAASVHKIGASLIQLRRVLLRTVEPLSRLTVHPLIRRCSSLLASARRPIAMPVCTHRSNIKLLLQQT
jgi:hypothetical protein